MYLAGVAPGRLLELGCGSGARLLLLRNLGWDVQGQDVDPKAVEAARAHAGCTVHLGSLEALELPKGSYDAIVMNHVLEHVVDPEGLLQRCSDLLVPGGRLVSIVPNLGSHAATEFGPHWWGLDPPRHLFHFSTSNLLPLAERAGLAGSEVHTAIDNHEFWLVGSYFLRGRARGHIELGGKLSASRKLMALARQYGVLLLAALRKVEGDECVLYWQKPRE
jgi:SAM-dependent methyltransferase